MNRNDINNKLIGLLKKQDSRTTRLLSSYEKRALQEYRTALEEIKKNIAKMFEKYGDDVTYSQMSQYNRLTNLEKQISGIIKDMTGESIKTTEKAIKDLYSESYYSTGYSLEKSLDAKLGFGQLSPKKISAAVLNPLDRITWKGRLKDHAQVYVKQIRSELTQGLIQGKGYAKIAKTVTEKTGINAYKVSRIIRTEGHRAQNAGRILAYEQSERAAKDEGMTTERQWLATLDGRTRDTHKAMDGKAAEKVDENFLFTLPSGVQTPGPGLSGIAAEDIFCRCTTIMQFKELPQRFRKDNTSKKIIDYKNYDEWAKGKGIKTSVQDVSNVPPVKIAKKPEATIPSKKQEIKPDAPVEESEVTITRTFDNYKETNRPYTMEDFYDEKTGHTYEKKVFQDSAKDYMFKSDDTDKLVRWGFELSDGRKVSYQSALKITQPGVYNRIKRLKGESAITRNMGNVWEQLSAAEKNKILESLDWDEVVNRAKKYLESKQFKRVESALDLAFGDYVRGAENPFAKVWWNYGVKDQRVLFILDKLISKVKK